MQLFALDRLGGYCRADRAARHMDYACIECGGAVRVRGGLRRQTHFFHLMAPTKCSQHAKSQEHLQVQFHLEALLGDGVGLEERFPSIERIADVVWWPQKLVFEVQCSPISVEEIRRRNKDYASLGLRVVWILHDQRYNKRKLSGAEAELRHCPHYFTNIDASGEGVVYDQFDSVVDGVRRRKLSPLPVDLSQPLAFNKPFFFSLACVRRRAMSFAGDLADLCVRDASHDYLLSAKRIEAIERRSKRRHALKRAWYAFVARPYTIALEMLLEKVSR